MSTPDLPMRERIDSALGAYLDEDRKYAVNVYVRQGEVSTVNIALSADGAERLLALVEKSTHGGGER